MIKILTLDDRHDSALLNSRRALETVRIDAFEKLVTARLSPECARQEVLTAKQLRPQVHLIEGVDGLIVVRLDLPCKAQDD